ncbi:hypothetical protein NUU61_000067 [Penicillium alfredii]|uniref:Rhodopsin domain-containing protein n=1 Tax=Penicillium alfredii TaxID=1506179 RepID=A0A9W9G908_9EURO|nr:uncharacterized protein NUU61_000067 [Penicillium alfredii]KAJ5114308.1 hypothetical protein NUU61_000067 [Penicillium alfredii]
MATVTNIFGPPPPGINLSDNKTPKNNGVVIAIFALAVVSIVLRFFARLRLQKARIEADDWLMAGSLVPLAALLASTIVGGDYGLGKHVWACTLGDVVGMRKILVAYVYIYLLLMPMIKLSILMFYWRIFGMNWMIWVCLALSIAWAIGCAVAFSCSCRPLSYFWSQFEDPKGGKCVIDLYGFYIGNAAVNVLTDFLILFVPIPLVWKLQMRKGQKIAVSSIFLLGGFVCIASVVRIYYMSFLNSDLDITWVMGDVYVWSTVEPCIGILCACLPTLQPLLRLTLKTIMGSSAGRQFGSSSRKWASGFRRRQGYGFSDNTHNSHAFHQLDDNGRKPKSSLNLRPDDDEAALTSSARVGPDTTRKDATSIGDDSDPISIRVKHDIYWREDQP